MSSIDKYVYEEANKRDSRMVFRKENGRIMGYINGEKVLDMRDRIGYLSDAEADIISRSISAFHSRERELEAERLEAERREQERIERERQERRRISFLNDARGSISYKMEMLNEALSALNEANLAKEKRLKALKANLDYVMGIIPEANLKGVANDIAMAWEEVKNSYSIDAMRLRDARDRLNSLSNELADDASIAEIEAIKARIDAIALNKDMRATRGFENIEEAIAKASKNAKLILSALKELSVIHDENIKNEIRHDLISINLLSEEAVRLMTSEIKTRIQEYRLTLRRDELRAEVDALASIEAIATGLNEFYTLEANDTYKLSDNSKRIKERAKSLINRFMELSKEDFEVVDKSIAVILNDLNELYERPLANDASYNLLAELEDEALRGEERAKDYRSLYEYFKEIRDELIEHGGEFNEKFNYKDYNNQNKRILNKIVAAMEAEQEAMLINGFNKVVYAMNEAGYKLFKTEQTEYYNEMYFIESKHPEVATRVFMDSNGMIRISLHRLAINGEVIDERDALRIAGELEDNIGDFVEAYQALGGSIEIDWDKTVDVSSDNALASLRDNEVLVVPMEAMDAYRTQVGASKSSCRKSIFHVDTVHESSCDREKRQAKDHSRSEKRAHMVMHK